MQYATLINFTINDGLMMLSAYLVGGINPGYLLVRTLRGVDLRNIGSGNLGARNAGRILGRKGFYFTLLMDVLKGACVVFLASTLKFSPTVVGVVVVAVIVGHIWPLWLHFRGGKGIATSLGAFAVLDYNILLLGGLMLPVAYVLTRSFLASWVIVLVVMPLMTYFLNYPVSVVVPLLVSVLMILIAHKENIKQTWFSSKYKTND